MNLNGIHSAPLALDKAQKQYTKNKEDRSKSASDITDTKEASNFPSDVYEKSDTTKKVSYQADTKTIETLKADAELRTNQLKELVYKILLEQGHTFHDANIYKYVMEGKLEVDEATRQKAIEDTSENGYYGVKETANRLVSFAKALTGGDPNKADEMIEAVKRGFDEAAKIWGGKLPDICNETIQDTLRQLEEWRQSP